MLKRGAEVNLKTRRKDAEPPLYVAVSAITNTSPMKLVAGKMVMEVTGLWARRSDVFEVFRLLIDAGADPNAPGARNETALKSLAFCRQMPDDLRLPLAETLMKAGGRPDVPNKDGKTALDMARLFKNQPLLGLLSRPVPERPAPTTAAAAAQAKAPKAKPAKAAAGLGAAHFHKFFSDGEAEWSLLAIKAPIERVTEALSLLVKAASITRNAEVKAAAGGADEVAPGMAVVEVRENPWTIVFRSLFHLDEKTLDAVASAAETLSGQLKTRAILYAAHGACDAARCQVSDHGEGSEPAEVMDESDADRFFREQGVYLPACYPKSKGKQMWLAVEKPSAKRISRGDLIAI